MVPIFPHAEAFKYIIANNGYSALNICYVVGAVLSMQCPIILKKA